MMLLYLFCPLNADNLWNNAFSYQEIPFGNLLDDHVVYNQRINDQYFGTICAHIMANQ